MKKAIGILALILATQTASAKIFGIGGDWVGNGGGLAEKNFLMAFANLSTYSRLCLSMKSCRLSAKEAKTLSDILKALPNEPGGRDQLFFVSESQRPGFFRLDGEMKVAQTGLKVGDPIFINTDMIYSQNQFGQIEAISIPTALAVLLHELGHHVSKSSHAELDLLGVKVSMFLQNRIQSTPLMPWNQDVAVTVVQSPGVRSFPQMLLNVGDDIFDLSSILRSKIFCPVLNIPIPILPFPDLQLGREEAQGAFLHNLHWEKANTSGVAGDFVVLGNLTHICPSNTNLLTAVNSFRARVRFTITAGQDGRPILDRNQVTITQDYEPWYKIIQLPFL